MSELDINTNWNTMKKHLNDIINTCIPNKMTTKKTQCTVDKQNPDSPNQEETETV